jgi:fused signal recognition particle receptor
MELLIIGVVALVVLVAIVGFVVVRGRGRPSPAPPAVGVGMQAGLAKSRHAVSAKLRELLGRGRIDGGFWSDLEDTLISADVGVAATASLLAAVKEAGPESPQAAEQQLHAEMVAAFGSRPRELSLASRPAVIVVVGVNGTGKTTSIAKLAAGLMAEGRSVTLAAADTFRAGAIDQLGHWAERVGADFVGAEPGADPASVAYEAYNRARSTGSDVVIVDTSGRLHTDRNLMEQLQKVTRVLAREAGAIDETLLVLDGTIGQNSITQAQMFTEAVDVSGLVLTKLDGTARGGVVVAIEDGLGVPVKFVGLGEGLSDLVAFDPDEFVTALLGD